MMGCNWMPMMLFAPEANTEVVENAALESASAIGDSSSESASIDTSQYENLSMEEMEAILNKEYRQGEMTAETLEDIEKNLNNYESVHQTLTNIRVSYNSLEGYRYTFPDANSLIISVPDGATTSDAVRIQNPGYMIVKVLRNGESNLEATPEYYTEPGYYTVEFRSMSVNQNAMTVNDYESTINFTIEESKYTSNTERVAPRGFSVSTVKLDGVTQLVGARLHEYTAETDGSYQITYVDDEDSTVTYTEEFLLDRVAPEVIFSQPIDKKVFIPVHMECNDSDATVKVVKNGIELEYSGELTEGGLYTITVVDKAGNENSYQVNVNYGGRGISPLWLVFFAGIFAAVGWKIRSQKKNLRIK